MEWYDAVGALTGNADRWERPLSDACFRWNIKTTTRINYFLAQCGHESFGFAKLVEDMNYSAHRLIEVWPNRFTTENAERYARNPRALAEFVYGGRMGNGPEGSGDGFAYIARGLFGITGRSNYTRCGEALGLNLVMFPESLEDPSHAANSAGWFWSTNRCNELADAENFDGVSGAISRGDPNKRAEGLESRRDWLRRVERIMA